MKIEMPDRTHLVFVRDRCRTIITVYKPSEWLYVLAGCCSFEKGRNLLDRIRWGLEKIGL